MRRPELARLSLVLTLLLVFSACQQNPSDRPETATTEKELTGESGYTIDMIDRRINIRMEGTDNTDFKGTAKLRIQSPKKNALLNLMVISTDGYVDVGGGLKLSIGITLAGVYEGDGDYTLPPNFAGPEGSSPDSATSNSRVTFYADNSIPERSLHAYDTLTKPCPIVIRDNGKAGEVHCPEIRSVENTTVSFDMVWGE